MKSPEALLGAMRRVMSKGRKWRWGGAGGIMKGSIEQHSVEEGRLELARLGEVV